jgi:hypothetical protein
MPISECNSYRNNVWTLGSKNTAQSELSISLLRVCPLRQ